MSNDSVIPDIPRLLAGASAKDRLQTIKTLRGLSSDPQPFVQALHDTDADVRCEAIAALSNLGCRSFLPFFIGALHDAVPQVRSAAVNALGRLGDPSARQELLRVLRDTHMPVQAMAAWALRQLRPADSE